MFVVAGGYKYAQWGEGVCFLRVPPGGAALRPLYTGWFAGFAELDAPRDRARPTGYEADGASAFAGSTFDPASFYRAAAVAASYWMTMEWVRKSEKAAGPTIRSSYSG